MTKILNRSYSVTRDYLDSYKIPYWNDYKDIKYIVSLSKTILEVKDKKSKIVNKEAQYIASTVLIWNDLNMELILNNLIRSGIGSPQIDIIKIDLNYTNLASKLTLFMKEYKLDDIHFIHNVEMSVRNIPSTDNPLNNTAKSFSNYSDIGLVPESNVSSSDQTFTAKIHLYEVNLLYFFNNINNYINNFKGSYVFDENLLKDKLVKDRMNLIDNNTNYKYLDLILSSPIYVFEGISWNNILLIFKLNDLNLNGGSISKRHKLNINEYKLSLFLSYSDLLCSRNAFYNSYKDNIFSNKKISKVINSSNDDLNLALNIISKDKGLINLMVCNPIIPEYFLNNFLIIAYLYKDKLIKCIEKLEELINNYINKLKCLEDKLLDLIGIINNNISSASRYKDSNIGLLNYSNRNSLDIEAILSCLTNKDFSYLALEDKNLIKSATILCNKILQLKSNLGEIELTLKKTKIKSDDLYSFINNLPQTKNDFFIWFTDKESSLYNLNSNIKDINLIIKKIDLISGIVSSSCDTEKSISKPSRMNLKSIDKVGLVNNAKEDTHKKYVKSSRSYSSCSSRVGFTSLFKVLTGGNIKPSSTFEIKNKQNFSTGRVLTAAKTGDSLSMDQVINKIFNNSISQREIKGNNNLNNTVNNQVTESSLNNLNKGESSLLPISTFDLNKRSAIGIINNNFIYDELIRILLDNPHNAKTQLKMEQFLLEQSKLILEEKLNKTTDINYTKLATYPQFIKIIKEKVPLIESLLNQTRDLSTSALIKQKKYLAGSSRFLMDPKYYNYKWIELLKFCSNSIIINLLLGRLLRIICNNSLNNNNILYTNFAMDIGEDLINQYLYSIYIENLKFKNSYSLTSSSSSSVNSNTLYKASESLDIEKGKELNDSLPLAGIENYTFSMWKIDNIKLVEEYSDNQLIFHIGSQLLNILMDLEFIIIKLQNSPNGSRSINQQQVLVLGPIFANIETNSFLTDLSFRVPMIVKPKEWKREIISHESNKFVERLGGFLNNDVKFTIPLIIENWELKKKSRILDPNIIYKIVNNLQSVPFKINTEVLDFIKKYGIEYDLIIDPNNKHPLEKHLTEEKSKSNKKVNLTYHQRKTLESFLSTKKLESNILGLANVYRYVKEFYIPVRIDNRGRVYCNVDYLNYQSTELAKALLLFSRGNKILKTDTLAANYLKIYGANCFGHKLDKASFEDRIKWCNNNELKIINFDLIREADNKLLFLAFCFEYKKYYEFLSKNCKYFITHLPIQLDATCNGFQHLALLTGDENLAKYLNLTPSSWYDQPDDFYSFLALNLNKYFKEKKIQLNKEIYKLLRQGFKIDESLLKRSIPQQQSTSLFIDKEDVNISSTLTDPINKLSDNKSLVSNSPLNFLSLDKWINIQSNIPTETNNNDLKLKEDTVIVDNSSEEENLNKLKEKLNLYDSYSRLANINIHRKIIKKPIMTKIYNVTLYSMAEYIKEEFNYIEKKEGEKENWYEYKNDSNLKIKEVDIYIIAKAIDTILYVEYPKYNRLNEYLKQIARICVELQIPIPWVLPSGLEVMQSYVTSNEIKLKPFKYRKNTFVLREATEKYNGKKQIRALMPNLVHSLDAASLFLLTDMFFNYTYTSSSEGTVPLNLENPKNLFAIHDCFATTANYLDIISNYIKTVYFNIYSNKAYILSFDEGIRENIKLMYGEDIFIWENNKWRIRLENKSFDYPDIFHLFNVEDENLDLLRHNSQFPSKFDTGFNILDQNTTLTSHLRTKGLVKLANRLEDFYSNILKSSYPVN